MRSFIGAKELDAYIIDIKSYIKKSGKILMIYRIVTESLVIIGAVKFVIVRSRFWVSRLGKG